MAAIRAAGPGDAAALGALGLDPSPGAGVVRLVACDGARVLAGLVARSGDGALWQFDPVMVAREAQGRGIGTALMIAACDRLVAIGAVRGAGPDHPWANWLGARAGVWEPLAGLGTAARARRLARLAVPLAQAAAGVPGVSGAPHPVANGARAAGRVKQRLGDVFGLTDFGVNRVTLAPGVWSSIPHIHSREDEFVLVLEGHLTLVSDSGTRVLGPGDCAGFPACGHRHHLENRSDAPAVYLEIGSRKPDTDEVDYPGEDLRVVLRADGSRGFVRRDGTPLADRTPVT